MTCATLTAEICLESWINPGDENLKHGSEDGLSSRMKCQDTENLCQAQQPSSRNYTKSGKVQLTLEEHYEFFLYITWTVKD